MLIIHRPSQGDAACHERLVDIAADAIPKDAIWIDLLRPTREEEKAVEQHLGIEIPTPEEMRDLEPSELIYGDHGSHYMTTRAICHSDDEVPKLVDVTFILTNGALVTVRFDEPYSFTMFQNRSLKPGGCGIAPEAILDGLMETIMDRAAEVLRGVGDRIDALSSSVFDGRSQAVARGEAYQTVLRKVGRSGQIISNVRESMVSIERVMLYLSAVTTRPQKRSGFQAEWRTALRDVQAIEEHATFLSSKLQFVLDATLGLVGLEQNRIIKLFSVAAVVLMPPTLIASIYGMNFSHMPELKWQYGYPMALGLMVVAAVLPYLFFRWKRWL
jgi:magnesium transporter